MRVHLKHSFGWLSLCLFDHQEHSQRQQSCCERCVVNQEENKRLCEGKMNLQQELMQMQKEKEKLDSEMLGLLQENSTLQMKVLTWSGNLWFYWASGDVG